MRWTLLLNCFWLITAFAVGCTPTQYAQQADAAGYGMIARGQRAALGGTVPFSLEYEPAAAVRDPVQGGLQGVERASPRGAVRVVAQLGDMEGDPGGETRRGPKQAE